MKPTRGGEGVARDKTSMDLPSPKTTPDEPERESLRSLAMKATPGDLDTAQLVDSETVDCPTCNGEGSCEVKTFTNFDNRAIGVQFFGVGDEHIDYEAYFRAAQPKKILALLDALHASEKRAEDAERERDEARASWRCYHCDEILTDIASARDHFGIDRWSDAACQLNREQGGLARLLRNCEDRLALYQAEDGPKDRELHCMAANHAQALIREEEKGYARGIADMKSERDEAREALGKVESARDHAQQACDEARAVSDALSEHLHELQAELTALQASSPAVERESFTLKGRAR